MSQPIRKPTKPIHIAGSAPELADNAIEKADAMKLETVACDLCGNEHTEQVANIKDPECIVEGVFAVVRCTNCGLQYLNPRPDKASIGSCYPNNYYAYSSEPHNISADTLKKRLKRTIRSNRTLSALARLVPGMRRASLDLPLQNDLDRWVSPGRILEVGCGSGGILDQMQENGWHTYGIEPSHEAASVAESKGHQVFRIGGDDAFPELLSTMKFDIIYLSHSLEHTHSPTKTLSNLRELLEPENGKMVIEVPNVESLITYLFGEHTPIFDVPRHLYFFSPETLSELLSKLGYRIESMRVISRPVQISRCFGMHTKLLTFDPWHREGDKLISEPAFITAMYSISEFAEQRSLGATIRVVVCNDKN